MHMSVVCLPACVFGHLVHAWSLRRPEESVRLSRTRVGDRCKPPCGQWELILGPVQEQQALITAEPSSHLQQTQSLKH